MTKVKNTSIASLMEKLVTGLPGGIEAQEAQGQSEIVECQQLPRKCNRPKGLNAAAEYHKMGILVFTSSKGDDLFLGVKLPPGWKKEATDHSMWNNLVDEKGRIRATFFYKAAFYDRDAFINFNCRYEVQHQFLHLDIPENYEAKYRAMDNATGEILFESPIFSTSSNNPYERLCIDHLNRHFPGWEDIHAYW